MKIKKKGNFFVAYRDENDIDSPDGVGMNSKIKVGDSLGRISIKTGGFTGNTVCLRELSMRLGTHAEEKNQQLNQQLIDAVIEDLKKDFEHSDYTVIEEILKNVPKQVLIHSLPEENWSKYQ